MLLIKYVFMVLIRGPNSSNWRLSCWFIHQLYHRKIDLATMLEYITQRAQLPKMRGRVTMFLKHHKLSMFLKDCLRP